MSTFKRALWVALIIASVWVVIVSENRDTPDAEKPTFILGKTMTLEVIECYQPWRCTFNVVGVENILGRSVMVYIEGIRSAKWGAICGAEDYEGKRGTVFLYEMLAAANNITLIRPYKDEGNHALIGTVLVDGVDVAQKMIDLGVAVPPGVNMNWCKPIKETEV